MATNEVSVPQMMIVTDTNRTFRWYPPSWSGERQLVDITDASWSIVGADCQTWPEVVNCLRAHGHAVVDQLDIDE